MGVDLIWMEMWRLSRSVKVKMARTMAIMAKISQAIDCSFFICLNFGY